MKWAWSLSTAAALMVGASASYAQEPKVFKANLAQRAPEYAPDRLIVGFKDAVTDAEAAQIVGELREGASLRGTGLRRAFHVLNVPKGRVMQAVSALRSDPRVRYAHPDWIVHALDIPPNDPYYPIQWNFQSADPAAGSIHVEGAWAVNPGGDPSVVVAVVDTGIAYENFGSFCQAPDLAGTHFMAGWDFVNGDAHANDDESHGTHVAGTIAQATNNAAGVAGIAYNVTLMPVKVLDATGSGSVSQIANGIRWAADHGANVINMSFGTSASPALLTALQDAVQYAASKGVVQVAAAGNSAGATPLYPAAYPEVISVAATLYNKQRASYTNNGANLCAPGGTSNGEDLNGDGYPDMILQNTFDPNTHTTCGAFGYWFFAGTSMASPHVAALAALIKSEQPSLTAAEIRQVLYDTADNSATSACSFGLIDARRALEAVAAGDHAPTVSIFEPTAGSMLFGNVTLLISAADAQTPAGDLAVEWSRDGTTWQAAALNAVSGYYEASWDTTGETEDSQVTLRARATDNASQTTEATPVTVKVNNSNQPPVAAFSYSCSSNVCSFNAAASSDADGTALSYAWTFGDGLTGVGKTPSHTFTATGTYVVNLTVMDELGATGSHAENVTIASINNTSHVSDLDGVGRSFGFFWQARVTIRISDTLNKNVASATVSGLFNDGTSVFRCTTSSSGTCSVVGYQFSLPCLTFTVTGVTHATLKYQPSLNSDPDGDSNGTQITVCRP